MTPKNKSMNISKVEKESILSVTRRRYALMRTKRARGRLLDEFCSTTGFSMKYAIKALSASRRVQARRGCPPGGTKEGLELL